jgi:outer membrane receptor for ferrienterochelin and colicins
MCDATNTSDRRREHNSGPDPVKSAEHRHRGRRLVAVVSGLCILSSRLAWSQTIDYQALQQLFNEPVTTSATGSPQRASDVPTNLQIISAADIQRSGVDNIPDILRFVAGIDVRSYTLDSANVAVRGYNQQFGGRLLVLIDGRQVYSDIYGFTPWDALPVQLAEIRQIEVVKGPNSALFGFNAVGGVINIVTFDPLADSRNEVAVAGGTQSVRDISGVATLHVGSTAGLRLSAQDSEARELSTQGLPTTFPQLFDSPRRRSAEIAARVNITPDVVLSSEATGSEVKYAQATPGPSFSTLAVKSNSFKLGLSANTDIGVLGVSTYRNAFSYQSAGLGSDASQTGPTSPGMDTGPMSPGSGLGPEGPVTGAGTSGTTGSTIGSSPTTDDTLYVLQVSDLFKVGARHTLRFGLEYRNDSANVGSGTTGRVTEQVYAASSMWTWQIARALAWTNSVRLDHMTLRVPPEVTTSPLGLETTPVPGVAIGEPSFNSGLVYAASARDTVRVTTAQGAQMPSLLDFGLQAAHGGSGVLEPRPAIVRNYEMDYEHKFLPRNISLITALFYQRTDNLASNLTSATSLSQESGAEGNVLGTAGASGFNFGSSTAIGGEATLKGAAAYGLRWSVSYAHISIGTNSALNSAAATSQSLDFSHGTPADVVLGGIGYGWRKLELDLQARWQTGFIDSLPSTAGSPVAWPVRAYAIVNGRLGYMVSNQLTCALSAQQLNEHRQFQTAGPAFERRLLLGVSWSP